MKQQATARAASLTKAQTISRNPRTSSPDSIADSATKHAIPIKDNSENNMASFNPIPINDPSQQAPTEAAYDQTLPDLSAMPEAELLTINIDVPAAVTTVQRIWPGLQAMRPELKAHFRDFDFTQFDRIERYALALLHAHCLF